MTDVMYREPISQQTLEAQEMAAFEKGRMQGEMEAIRRLESEQGAIQMKSFQAEQAPVVQRPDVIEINRLTWAQRVAAYTGEASLVAFLVCTIVWLDLYRGDVGWSDDYDGDNIGNVGMWNTNLLTSALGIIFLAQAILMYRILPINLNPWLNRAIFCFFEACAITCFVIALVAQIKSPPEATFWAVDNWCFALALAVMVTHGLYAMTVTLMEPMFPVDYEHWAEVNNKLTFESPEQRRDHSAYNQAGRTVYTPAPVSVPRTSSTIPPANANVGAEVPVAPANAPRWAENPNTHSENYFLLPRAKWAVCGFVGMGAAILMHLAAVEHILASGRKNWAQGQYETDANGNNVQLNEVGNEAGLIGAIGLLLLAGLLMVAYAAMPPRTTLVKNGILVDNNRRSSVSHNAETRLGNIV